MAVHVDSRLPPVVSAAARRAKRSDRDGLEPESVFRREVKSKWRRSLVDMKTRGLACDPRLLWRNYEALERLVGFSSLLFHVSSGVDLPFTISKESASALLDSLALALPRAESPREVLLVMQTVAKLYLRCPSGHRPAFDVLLEKAKEAKKKFVSPAVWPAAEFGQHLRRIDALKRNV